MRTSSASWWLHKLVPYNERWLSNPQPASTCVCCTFPESALFVVFVFLFAVTLLGHVYPSMRTAPFYSCLPVLRPAPHRFSVVASGLHVTRE